MRIFGFFGSPRLEGKLSKLMQRALEGAESTGAETKRFDLINLNIKYCQNCGTCVFKNPELPIGNCTIKDDVHSILEEYLEADGHIYASPVYDVFISALMKTFLERKMMLMYKPKDGYGIPAPRVPQNFKKKASFIVTGNAFEVYDGITAREIMGDPCFEALESHLMLEQIDTVDKLYVGGMERITEETLAQNLDTAYQMGIHLVEEIEKARREG